MNRVLVIAGGTGGHVFPAIAIAKELREKSIEVFWLGTRHGFEIKWVNAAGFPFFYIDIQGLRGKSWRQLLSAPWRLFRALYQSIIIIRKINPDVVIGMGGFVAGPGGLAAWLLRKPLVIHEQNTKAGLTNKFLARIAKRVLSAFPNTMPERCFPVVTGNPLRAEILAISSPAVRWKSDKKKFHLLILGGSLGALAINEAVPRALSLLPDSERPLIWHQTGHQHLQATTELYDQCGINDAKISAFIEDMAAAYEWADLVICRAGALTVSELMAAGVGSILVPYPYAVDDHQTKNAQYLVDAGAALMLKQSAISPLWLKDTLLHFNHHREELLRMANAAWGLRVVDATTRVVQQCFDVAGIGKVNH